MNDTFFVQFVERRRQANPDSQERSQLHESTKAPVERLATRVIKEQHSLTAFAHECTRSHG